MKLLRRKFLNLAAGAAVLPAIPSASLALDYPTRSVRVITSFPPGNVDDMLARQIAQSLSERFDKPFAVDNQPLSKGTEAMASALPDGHTLFLVTAANVIRAILDTNLHFDFVRDVAPIASTSRNPFVMVTNPSLPPRTMPEFITYAKTNPGKINMASSGKGTIIHLTGEQFEMMTQIKMVHVPYDGLPTAVSALINGQAQVMFTTIPSAIEQIKNGKLFALAVTGAKRSEVLPDVPTIGDFVPGFEATGIQGLCAPKSTPSEIIATLNTTVNAAISDPQVKARLGEFGNTVLSGSTAEYARVLVSEAEKWTKVIRAANVTLE